MLSGDALPAGEYEVIEARSSATRWVGFDLREDGSFDGSLNGV